MWPIVFGLLLAVLLARNGTVVAADDETTYVVQPGDTVWRLAQRFGTTVDELVNLNDIRNPDLIFVDQVLTLPPGQATVPAQAAGGPLSLSWSLADWQPADPDYVATLSLQASGGTPPWQGTQRFFARSVISTLLEILCVMSSASALSPERYHRAIENAPGIVPQLFKLGVEFPY